jgi:hypothetical protein
MTKLKKILTTLCTIAVFATIMVTNYPLDHPRFMGHRFLAYQHALFPILKARYQPFT